MKTSYFGSIFTTLAYINWLQLGGALALLITIVSGLITGGYTIYKWRKEYKKDNEKISK